MRMHDAPAGPPSGNATGAGLVMLYAPSYLTLDPAYPFDRPTLVIGSAPESDIVLRENAVSRRHASVRYEDGAWVLTDLGSRNGVLVDGQFVQQARLAPMQEIRIGDAIFKFVPTFAEGYRSHRIDGAVHEDTPERAAERWQCPIHGGYQMTRLVKSIERVAPSPISVILIGESGTGKEVFARHVHDESRRRGQFVAVNCAAIPQALWEGELFGAKKGAFTGADCDRPGLVRAADGGTLFLDEIADMPLDAQTKLLRVLQAREVMPLGARQSEPVDVRVVCATQRNLGALVKEGRFRGDLFARLNDHAIEIPPLRHRKEDVFLLVRVLLGRHGSPSLGVTMAFMAALLHYDFPYNVRELESLLRRGITLCPGHALGEEQLPGAIVEAMEDYGRRSSSTPPDTAEAVPAEEKLRALLKQNAGNVAAVARDIGRPRATVHRWITRHGIRIDEYRG